MAKKARFLVGFLIVATTITFVTCKPITYYLEQVYKAYGKVYEAGTGIPLESVEVFVGTYQYSVLTNGLGDYGLELAEGTWLLSYVKDGYQTETRTVTVSATMPRVKVDVALTHPGFRLSGTWASPAGITVANGMYGYLKLVEDGAPPTNTALFWTRSSAFSGGSASYSITAIPAGTYTAYAFIDMNANAPNAAAAMPDSGDSYLQTGQRLIISGDLTLNLGSGGWITPSPEESWTYIGIWVNSLYNGGAGKIVLTITSIAMYANDSDPAPAKTETLDPVNDWASGGAHYFKVIGSGGYALFRVSNNNSTLEVDTKSTADQVTIDTTSESYLVYARQ